MSILWGFFTMLAAIMTLKAICEIELVLAAIAGVATYVNAYCWKNDIGY